jgi:hypothetical protein
MKRLSLVFLLVIVMAGGAIGAGSTPAYAQGYGGFIFPPPPLNPLSTPWVGPNTPWVYYQGDWFLNGILYQFFGDRYGWAPYYAYPPTYIVRPHKWYEPKWNVWYKHNPHYWQSFKKQYPYWGGHRVGQRYDQKFYNKYHHGQGIGWHQGFQGGRPPGGPGPGPHPSETNGPGFTKPGTHGPGTPGLGVHQPEKSPR